MGFSYLQVSLIRQIIKMWLSPTRDLCPTGMESYFGLCFYRCSTDLSALRRGESTRKRAEREREKQAKANSSVTASHSSSSPFRKWLLREAANDNTLVFRKLRKDPS